MKNRSGKSFYENYARSRQEKNSILCVGLDIKKENLSGKDNRSDIFNFCLEVIEETQEAACAYKPNSQFLLFELISSELRKINREIHKAGCISILDHKLSDIGSTNHSAIEWIGEAGFDSFTYSPFPGNIGDTVSFAHSLGLGVFTLTLMSNPESAWVQKEALFEGKPLYLEIARKLKVAGSDGLVVGATGNAGPDDIKAIRETVGSETVFLCPGVGAQGGDAVKVIESSGENVLINVGRDILEKANRGERARKYLELFNSLMP